MNSVSGSSGIIKLILGADRKRRDRMSINLSARIPGAGSSRKAAELPRWQCQEEMDFSAQTQKPETLLISICLKILLSVEQFGLGEC